MTDEHARNVRVAANERLIRESNWDESLDSDAGRADEEHEFHCACGRPDCEEVLLLTIPEYRAVHSRPHRFIVAPEHVDPEIEHVVEDHGHYVVVEKAPEYQGTDPTWPTS